MRVLICALGVAMAAYGLAGVATAYGAGEGVIEGRLVNGTPGGPRPEGSELVLHVFRNGNHAEPDRPTPAPDGGRIFFDGLETGSEYSYQVTAGYGGAPYESEQLRFEPGEQVKRLDLMVYETTDVNPGLAIRRSSMVLADFDVGSQTIRALEIVTLENPSDRTFLPSQNGPAGPMGLLRFPLPSHAADLTPGTGLEFAEIITVDRGFATTAAVPPGAKEILFSYRFPYQPGLTRILRSVPYPTAELRIVVPEDGPTVDGVSFEPTDSVQVGGQRYRVYTAHDLDAGRQLDIAINNLPGRWPLNLPFDRVSPPVWGGLGVGFAVAVVLVYVAWARRRPPPAPSRAPRDEAALLQKLVVLDEAFTAGELSEEVYRTQRAVAKAQLVDLFRG